MHFLFGVLIFIFVLVRSLARSGRSTIGSGQSLYGRAAETFEALAAQHGGETYRTGWKKLLYVTPDRGVELHYHADSSRLVLRLRKSFAIPLTFYRVPRLVYAFLDAYLRPSMKVEGTHYLIGSRDSEILPTLIQRNGFVPLLRSLDASGFSGQISKYGLKMWKRIRPQELSDVSIMNYIRLARDLAHVWDTETVIIPVQPVSSDKRCAYCKELLGSVDPVQYCESCGTPHHRDCFELNGRCTVYGCEKPIPRTPLTLNTESQSHRV